MGTLYYGDNLDILRRYLKDESVDLVYLDPLFNSARIPSVESAETAVRVRIVKDMKERKFKMNQTRKVIGSAILLLSPSSR